MKLTTLLSIYCVTGLAFCLLGGGFVYLVWYLLETYIP